MKIVFSVIGNGAPTADITFGYTADLQQENGAKLPWTKEVDAKGDVVLPTITALSNGEGAGSISCKITVDGKVVKENQSTGAFAVVTCTADKL